LKQLLGILQLGEMLSF